MRASDQITDKKRTWYLSKPINDNCQNLIVKSQTLFGVALTINLRYLSNFENVAFLHYVQPTFKDWLNSADNKNLELFKYIYQIDILLF